MNVRSAAFAELAGYCPETSVPGVLEQFRKSYPNARVLQRDAIFNDPTIDVI